MKDEQENMNEIRMFSTTLVLPTKSHLKTEQSLKTNRKDTVYNFLHAYAYSF